MALLENELIIVNVVVAKSTVTTEVNVLVSVVSVMVEICCIVEIVSVKTVVNALVVWMVVPGTVVEKREPSVASVVMRTVNEVVDVATTFVSVDVTVVVCDCVVVSVSVSVVVAVWVVVATS